MRFKPYCRCISDQNLIKVVRAVFYKKMKPFFGSFWPIRGLIFYVFKNPSRASILDQLIDMFVAKLVEIDRVANRQTFRNKYFFKLRRDPKTNIYTNISISILLRSLCFLFRYTYCSTLCEKVKQPFLGVLSVRLDPRNSKLIV